MMCWSAKLLIEHQRDGAFAMIREELDVSRKVVKVLTQSFGSCYAKNISSRIFSILFLHSDGSWCYFCEEDRSFQSFL